MVSLIRTRPLIVERAQNFRPSSTVRQSRSLDATGTHPAAALSGSGLAELRSAGHGAVAEVVALSGTTASVVSFGTVVSSDFTICSATRYTGGTQRRILQGGDGGNWLHGHWGGLAGVAYYWGNQTAAANHVAPKTDWVVMCGSNAGADQLKLVNGADVGTATGGVGNVSLWINGGGSGATSDFAVAEVLVWDRGLTSEETYAASTYLMGRVLGVTPPAAPPSPPCRLQRSSTADWPCWLLCRQ